MSFTNIFQVQDSSSAKKPIAVEGNINDLDLIEEIDDSIVLPKPKLKYRNIIKDTGTQQTDTFYGLKNQRNLPVRKIEYSPTTETVIEKLFTPTSISRNVASWQTIVLLTAIVLLGISKAFSRNRFNQAVRALFNYGVAQEVTREEKVFFHRSNIMFTLVHLLTFSLILYHIRELIHIDHLESKGVILFLLILLGVIIIYVIKYVFSQVLFFILNDVSIATEYIFNVSLFNNLLGVIYVLPLCLAYFSSLPFSYILLYLVIPFSVITYFLRLARLFLIGKLKGISYFYIFLYICTLEILPLVVLFRIFIF